MKVIIDYTSDCLLFGINGKELKGADVLILYDRKNAMLSMVAAVTLYDCLQNGHFRSLEIQEWTDVQLESKDNYLNYFAISSSANDDVLVISETYKWRFKDMNPNVRVAPAFQGEKTDYIRNAKWIPHTAEPVPEKIPEEVVKPVEHIGVPARPQNIPEPSEAEVMASPVKSRKKHKKGKGRNYAQTKLSTFMLTKKFAETSTPEMTAKMHRWISTSFGRNAQQEVIFFFDLKEDYFCESDIQKKRREYIAEIIKVYPVNEVLDLLGLDHKRSSQLTQGAVALSPEMIASLEETTGIKYAN